MKNKDEQLLADLSRRNWIVFILLVGLSLIARSADFTLGVAAGGLLAITAYSTLNRSLTKLLLGPGVKSAKGFQIGYFLRLAMLGIAFYFILTQTTIHPLGLCIGLSVVVINLIWTTFSRTKQLRRR